MIQQAVDQIQIIITFADAVLSYHPVAQHCRQLYFELILELQLGVEVSIHMYWSTRVPYHVMHTGSHYALLHITHHSVKRMDIYWYTLILTSDIVWGGWGHCPLNLGTNQGVESKALIIIMATNKQAIKLQLPL